MKKKHLNLVMTALALRSLILGPVAPAQMKANCPVQPATLRAMRDCYRPLLILAPTARDPRFVAQQALLEQYADDMMDRNLLYVPVLVDPGQLKRPLDAPYVVLKQPELNAIRSRLKIGPSDFAAVLIGKDGGEKFRTTKPISVLRLDTLVDAMPMGQQEKRARTGSAQ